MTKFVNMLKDESGAAAAEYALILAIIGTGIAYAAYNLGTAIKNSMTTASGCITANHSTNTVC